MVFFRGIWQPWTALQHLLAWNWVWSLPLTLPNPIVFRNRQINASKFASSFFHAVRQFRTSPMILRRKKSLVPCNLPISSMPQRNCRCKRMRWHLAKIYTPLCVKRDKPSMCSNNPLSLHQSEDMAPRGVGWLTWVHAGLAFNPPRQFCHHGSFFNSHRWPDACLLGD